MVPRPIQKPRQRHRFRPFIQGERISTGMHHGELVQFQVIHGGSHGGGEAGAVAKFEFVAQTLTAGSHEEAQFGTGMELPVITIAPFNTSVDVEPAHDLDQRIAFPGRAHLGMTLQADRAVDVQQGRMPLSAR